MLPTKSHAGQTWLMSSHGISITEFCSLVTDNIELNMP